MSLAKNIASLFINAYVWTCIRVHLRFRKMIFKIKDLWSSLNIVSLWKNTSFVPVLCLRLNTIWKPFCFWEKRFQNHIVLLLKNYLSLQLFCLVWRELCSVYLLEQLSNLWCLKNHFYANLFMRHRNPKDKFSTTKIMPFGFLIWNVCFILAIATRYGWLYKCIQFCRAGLAEILVANWIS